MKAGTCAQAANCSPSILPMAAQALALTAGASGSVMFEVHLTSSAGNLDLSCDVGVLDSLARPSSAGSALTPMSTGPQYIA